MRLAAKPHDLLKPNKNSLSSAAAAAFRRILSAKVGQSPAPPVPDASSPISQILPILTTTDPNDWPSNPNLTTLLSSLSPDSLLSLTRKLPDYRNAINFFNHLSTMSLRLEYLSFAFQAVMEHAMRENPKFPSKLNELFQLSREMNVPLSINAATLLIKCFGNARMLEELVMVFDSMDPGSKNTNLLNLVIDGFFKCSRVDEALKLLKEMLEHESSTPPNTNTLDIVLSSILRKKRSGRVVIDDEICQLVSSFGEHGIFPDTFWLTQIIRRLCHNRNCSKAWEVLHKVIDMGCDVGTLSCNALLTGLAKEQDYAKMNLFMKEMQEKGIIPDVGTVSIMINHLCKFRMVDDALELFEKMRDEKLGIQPDLVTFNILINGLCKVGRQEEGLQLMERMMSEAMYPPNTVTYNSLIDGFCKAGELERGRELFERMNEAGVEPNVITLNTLLDGMCKNGRVSGAMGFFRQMEEKGLKGNTVTYTILIVAFCSANNIDKAMKIFDEMQENACSPDAIVYYGLISGLSQAGRMDDASLIVSKMKAAGLCLDIVSYNVLLSGFCRKKKLDKVCEMLKDMEQARLKPDRVTYNTLISYFCAEGNFEHARRLVKKMIKDGLTPTVVTYGALIQGYCLNDNLAEAMRIFRDMGSSLKVTPNTVIYNMLINAQCNSDDVEVALSLLDDMKDKGVKPNTTTYNAIFKGLQRRNWFEKAIELMDQMTEHACKPDYITMEILTEWLSVVGETKKLQSFVRGYKVST
ncbi:pentatricopeptide repeat-containing protein mitochondrial [Dorcoceras hygrometricum]|nr:pentatricopeptide repeat-containing protein mitochondrial [Dorcoceras hygrometricum]